MKKQQTKIVNIIGFPMDLGADRRGVDMGPSAIRIAGIKEKLERLGYKIVDSGNIIIQIMERQKITDNKLKYLNEILKTSNILAGKIERTLDNGQFPLCLGGDHSMAIGSIAGVSAYCKKHNKELGVLWIDAHTDMNTDKTTPSGNIHGMPMAVAVGLGNDQLVNFYGFSPKVKAENCALIGVRSIDPYERLNIKSINLPVYTMSDIDKLGI
ncbi:MAG TPA: arginase, partial [Ignavibacteria bacterium]|nr:arginase [Ignavibacteria bacterium]